MSKWEFISPKWSGWSTEGELQFNRKDWEFTGQSTAEAGIFVAPSGELKPDDHHVHLKDVVRVRKTTWPKLVGKGAGVELAETLFSACAEAGDQVSIDRLVIRIKQMGDQTDLNRRKLIGRINEIADGAFQLTWRGDPHDANWTSTNTHYREWQARSNYHRGNSIKPDHPVLLKSIIEGVSPVEYCAKICEGKGKGCELKPENVIAIGNSHSSLDTRTGGKILDCVTLAAKSRQ